MREDDGRIDISFNITENIDEIMNENDDLYNG